MPYLDHNATTPMLPEALEAMTRAAQEAWGNPSSLHEAGRKAKQIIEDARERLAKLLHAEPHEIVFTGGGTEACNFGILGAARALRETVREGAGRAATGSLGHIVCSAIEHPAVKSSIFLLESEGWEVTWVKPTADGVVEVAAVEAALRPDTALCAVMAANNEIGTIQPYAEIGELLRGRNIVFFCDMVQALGKIKIDMPATNIDVAAFAAHKIGGPKGVGALYIRKGLAAGKKPVPLVRGGGQERGLRGGTENVAGIAGFGAAATWWLPRHALNERQWVKSLRDILQFELTQKIPEIVINAAEAMRLPNTLHATFPGARGDTLVMALDLRGIAVSAGSACASGSVKPSEVLLAMGRSPEAAISSLRLSLGFGNTPRQMIVVAEAVAAAYKAARS